MPRDLHGWGFRQGQGQRSVTLRRRGDQNLKYRLFTASPADASAVELVIRS